MTYTRDRSVVGKYIQRDRSECKKVEQEPCCRGELCSLLQLTSLQCLSFYHFNILKIKVFQIRVLIFTTQLDRKFKKVNPMLQALSLPVEPYNNHTCILYRMILPDILTVFRFLTIILVAQSQFRGKLGSYYQI